MIAGRILIAQPDPNSAFRLQKTLEYDGYEILVANTGQEAWDLCRQRLPQAMVFDSDLPDMTGLELLRRIRGSSRTRQIYIVALIRRQENVDQIAGLEMGADDSLLKPYDVEEVRLRIRNAIRRTDTGSLVNPATGLPGGRLIEAQLRELLKRANDWAMLRVAVRHLDEFADAHGFLAGEDVLRTTARIVSEALDEYGRGDDFIGHSGVDAFVIITSATVGSKLKPLLAQRLEEIGQTHFSPDEREQGFVSIRQSDGSELQASLITLDIQMITAADGPFQDIMQLTSALG